MFVKIKDTRGITYMVPDTTYETVFKKQGFTIVEENIVRAPLENQKETIINEQEEALEIIKEDLQEVMDSPEEEHTEIIEPKKVDENKVLQTSINPQTAPLVKKIIIKKV